MGASVFRLRSGRRGLDRAVAAAFSLWLAGGLVRAGYAVGRESALRVEVTPLVVESGATRSLTPIAVEATRDDPGIIETSIVWSPPGPPLGLVLEVAVSDGDGERGHALRLAASARLGDAPPIRSDRVLTLAEGSTGLYDVLEEGGRRLVLSVRVEEIERPVVHARRSVESPVLLRLTIERREGERSEPLETNRLVTFLNEGVEYAFAQGEGDGREALRVVVTPLRLDGDLAELQVEVTGSLPSATGPHVLARTERILASRRSTSKLDVTVGDPPTGYRFLITPDF
jgi:hypothetical protein